MKVQYYVPLLLVMHLALVQLRMFENPVVSLRKTWQNVQSSPARTPTIGQRDTLSLHHINDTIRHKKRNQTISTMRLARSCFVAIEVV